MTPGDEDLSPPGEPDVEGAATVETDACAVPNDDYGVQRPHKQCAGRQSQKTFSSGNLNVNCAVDRARKTIRRSHIAGAGVPETPEVSSNSGVVAIPSVVVPATPRAYYVCSDLVKSLHGDPALRRPLVTMIPLRPPVDYEDDGDPRQ